MSASRIVSAVGRAWVSVYTAGLPVEARDRRRKEIESDLWEEAAAAQASGASPPAGSMAGRFIRGVPSDVVWRLGLDGGAPDEITSSWTGRIAVLLVLSIAVTSLVYAVLHTFGYFGEHRTYAFFQIGMLILTLVLLRGLSLSSERPGAGAALIAVSGLVLAFLWMFMFPIAIAVLAVVAYGLIRAWRIARPGGRASARDSIDSS